MTALLEPLDYSLIYRAVLTEPVSSPGEIEMARSVMATLRDERVAEEVVKKSTKGDRDAALSGTFVASTWAMTASVAEFSFTEEERRFIASRLFATSLRGKIPYGLVEHISRLVDEEILPGDET